MVIAPSESKNEPEITMGVVDPLWVVNDSEEVILDCCTGSGIGALGGGTAALTVIAKVRVASGAVALWAVIV
jgi:methylase of polypeptide subunit release factors